ncbi:hypothetical protein TNCV_403001 [Trichonephila clavipes]|nr:hypothetical protein TNCV_403001 [Trichonephila clavipes]
MKASPISSPGEDSTRFILSETFRLITEKNMPPFLWCRLLAWKFFFQTLQQGHYKVVKLLSTHFVIRLMPSSDPVQMWMLCGNLG